MLDLGQWTDAALQASALEPFQQLALWALRDARDPAPAARRFTRWGPVLARAGLTRAGRDRLALLVEYLFQVIDPQYWNQLSADSLAAVFAGGARGRRRATHRPLRTAGRAADTAPGPPRSCPLGVMAGAEAAGV